jgi:hypothetical protein
MDYKKQISINNKFLHIYKSTICKYKINTQHLIKKLEEFEKKDIDDQNIKNLIKTMLEVPYYEKLNPVNSLRKFKLLQEKLKTIHQELIDENIIKRLAELRKPPTTINRKADKLLELA